MDYMSMLTGLSQPRPNLSKTKIKPDDKGCYHIHINTSLRKKSMWEFYSSEGTIDKKCYDNFVKDTSYVPKNAPMKITIQTTGGSAFYSMKIAQRIKTHQGHTTAIIQDYAMSGGTLIALMCDEIEMTENACLGSIDVQWLGPVNSLLPAARRWKERNLVADIFTEVLDKKQKSVLNSYRSMLSSLYSQDSIEKIIDFFYSSYDHEKPLFFDDVKECRCVRVKLIEDVTVVTNETVEVVEVPDDSSEVQDLDGDSCSEDGMDSDEYI